MCNPILPHVVKILRTPRQSGYDAVDFLWYENGVTTAKRMSIELRYSYVFEFGYMDDTFLGSELLYNSFVPYAPRELDNFQLTTIIEAFPNKHTASELPVYKRQTGKKKRGNMHEYHTLTCQLHAKKFNKKGSYYF